MTAFLDGALQRRSFGALAVAISGGSDSTALLLLAQEWCCENQCSLYAVTVDHGLRSESKAEATQVARLCAELGIAHTILTVSEPIEGNLQAGARAARYREMKAWAIAHNIDAIALGHTADDQAETILLRLLRGSGVDGLSSMRSDWEEGGIRWMRPLLAVSRQDLRAMLTQRGHSWIDDPSNEDIRFDRVKARQALSALAPLGITTAGLIATGSRLSDARDALEQMTKEAAQSLAREDRGNIVIDLLGFQGIHPEIQNRLLAHALCWVSGQHYRPRLEALKEAKDAVFQHRQRSLHGCLIATQSGQIWVSREPAALASMQSPPGVPWDGYWLFGETATQDHVVKALGEEGMSQLPTWREAKLPRQALLAAPSLWKGEVLVACPHAGFGPNHDLKDLRGAGHFRASIGSL